MEALVKAIKHERPNLSESSIKTYTNVLKSMFKDIWPGKEFDHTLYITEQEKAMNHMQSIKFNIRKTILSALVSFTTGVVQTKYRNQMMEDSQKYTALQHQHIKTEEQKENWMSWKEIEEHLAKLKNQYYYVFKEEKPTREEIMNLQSYVILACYVLMPPRRAMDYCKMKVRNYDKATDNFYEGGKFHFLQYKTAKFMGVQIQKVPKTLELLLRKWIAFHDMDYLFANSDDKEIAGSGMTKILNTIFKPKLISVNMLRHIYITEKSAPLIDKLKETADAMAHSTGMQGLYVKKD
jgi:hypothetical protein